MDNWPFPIVYGRIPDRVDCLGEIPTTKQLCCAESDKIAPMTKETILDLMHENGIHLFRAYCIRLQKHVIISQSKIMQSEDSLEGMKWDEVYQSVQDEIYWRAVK